MTTKHETGSLNLLDPPPSTSTRIAWICDTCGSPDVTADAAACWDVDRQCWQLVGTQDGRYCAHCPDAIDALVVFWDRAESVRCTLRNRYTDEQIAGILGHPTHPAHKLAVRLRELESPRAKHWTFERVERSATAGTYYCAADEVQALRDDLRAAACAARAIGPHVAAILDGEGDLVFVAPFDCTSFDVDAAALMRAARGATP